MAEKRMFTKLIVDSDAFLDMPLSTQALYFHLAMRADDEGFVNGYKKIMRMIGCSEDEMKVLLAKRFVLGFESGVIVIKHWKMHNCIRKDRLKPTPYQEEKSCLIEKENGSYSFKKYDSQVSVSCQSSASQLPVKCRHSIDKNSIDKNSIDKNSIVHSPAKAEQSIAYKEIIDYLNEKLGTRYKSTTNKNKELIKARLNEGFTVDDFKTVIDNKTLDWKGSDMEKFLRPVTLFGTKFESYLNTKIVKRTKEGHVIGPDEVIPF